MNRGAQTRLHLPGLYLGLACVSVAGYLLVSRSGGYLGFPLDDAWIHQTYARNLAAQGQFAFVPGQPSAGSTSPLWTAALALGYALRLDYQLWTYVLGALLLGANAWLVHRLVAREWPAVRLAPMAAGAFVLVEWHLVWAAASGMETLLFSALALAVFALPVGRAALWAGLAAGLSVLARPDGLLLLPVAVGLAWLCGPRRLRATGATVIGFVLVFVPYLLFNYWLSGSAWPNTLYAKQAEYAVLLERPLVLRLLSVGVQPVIGAQALLVPGLLAAAWLAARRRQWPLLLAAAWLAASLAAYALRLPATYQHGRYLMPVIPFLLALGVGGTAGLLRPNALKPAARILSRAWLLAGLALAVAFWVIGAQAYRRDVQIIESEMVASARWISANTAVGSLVAAHDIGALGYFGERRVLDLAGLVSPEVIPLIRDEAGLREWLFAAGADYLLTFPGWYPELVHELDGHLLFTTGAPFSPAAGGENMAVYRWPSESP
jgi:hypothetical protein